MTLQDKVKQLVRYCGQHPSHGFMVDERNLDKNFNVQLQEEKIICQNVQRIKIIILTGEAGDGKSRILRNITGLLEKEGFSEPCRDFSALSEEKKKELIYRIRNVLNGKSDEKLIVLANVGVFTQNAIRYDIHLMEDLTDKRDDVYIYNFEKRNLAENKENFREIMTSFLSYSDPCPNKDCFCYEECAYKKNIKELLLDDGIEAMRTICNAIYLKGGHLTFRELLSLLSYAVTFAQNCEERQQYERCNDDKFIYYNIFEKGSDALLKKVSDMDPALERGKYEGDIHSKKEYICFRRKKFFKNRDRQYEMLHADYLPEFYEVLNYMNCKPYYYDVSREKNETLQMLKRGINKMISRGKDDAGLVITDTPFIFDGKIRLEFMGLQNVALIWNRYDLRIGQKMENESRMWNQFCLSYISNVDGSKELISLVIDYHLFCYLMMCSQDYFVNRGVISLEENAVNTFYRKILQQKNQLYQSIAIRFEEKDEEICDFSLTVHEEEDLFTGEKTQTIFIRKED